MTNRRTERLALVGLLAMLLTAERAPAWYRDLDMALEVAATEGRLIVVDLYADWCVWCKRLDEEVFASPEFSRFAQERILLRLDTEDGADGSAVVERYGVTTLPTTLVLDPGQVLVGAVHGFLPAAPYVTALEQEIERFAALGERYARLLASEDAAEVERLADDLRQRRDGRRAAHLYERLLEPGTGGAADRARARFNLADSLRLGAEFDRAEGIVEELRRLPPGAGGPRPAELDLLAARIWQDRGDCDQAREAFRFFLEAHPASDLRSSARSALEQLRCT